MGEKTKQKETDKRRKFSFDITVENYEYIQNYSKNAGKPIGSSINSLIALLLKMPTQMRDELATFCELRMEQLALDYRKVGEFEQLTVQELNDAYSEFYALLTSSKHLYPAYTKNYVKIQLKDAYVFLPADWYHLISDNHPEQSAASRLGVIELYVASNDIYHFAFFTNHSTNKEFSAQELDELKELCIMKNSEFKDYISQIKKYPVMTSNNPKYKEAMEEYNKSPHMTLHLIMRTDDPDYDKNAKQPYDCLIYAYQK